MAMSKTAQIQGAGAANTRYEPSQKSHTRALHVQINSDRGQQERTLTQPNWRGYFRAKGKPMNSAAKPI